jgi:hypothetical protein
MRLFGAIIDANHRAVGGNKSAGLHSMAHHGGCAHLISTRLQPGVSDCPVNKTRFNGFSLFVEAVETALRWSATAITGLKPGANENSSRFLHH